MAKQLRLHQTASEAMLWEHLKGCNRFGHKFRRQYPIDRYITDFCCVKLRLVIEIDGMIHEHQKERDQQRDQILQLYGYKTLRFTNEQIGNDINTVLQIITERTTSLSWPSSAVAASQRREGEGLRERSISLLAGAGKSSPLSWKERGLGREVG